MFVVSAVWTATLDCLRRAFCEPLLDELSRLAQGARRPHMPSLELSARHSNRTYATRFFCTGVMDEFWALTKEK